jgi:hypothetical protein
VQHQSAGAQTPAPSTPRVDLHCAGRGERDTSACTWSGTSGISGSSPKSMDGVAAVYTTVQRPRRRSRMRSCSWPPLLNDVGSAATSS